MTTLLTVWTQRRVAAYRLPRLAGLLFLASLVALGRPLAAAPVSVNFDVNSSNNPISAPPAFVQTTRLTTLYSPLGVTFAGPGGNDGGAILNQTSNFGISARSGVNFLAFNKGAVGQYQDGGTPRDPETLLFSPAASSVSIYAGDGSAHTFLMQAYDSGNQLVASNTLINAGGQYVNLTVSAPAITKVMLTESIGDGAFVYDDLSFTQVPECSTLILACIGIWSLTGARRWRNLPNWRA